MNSTSWTEFISNLMDTKGRVKASITYAIFAAGIHYIWRASNKAQLEQKGWSAQQLVHEIKEQMKTRILYLHSKSPKYSLYIDRILSV